MYKHKYEHLFEPMTIAGVTFKNRILAGPHMVCMLTPEGYPTEHMTSFYEEKAKGGVAQITLGDTPVDNGHAVSNPMHVNILDRMAYPHFGRFLSAVKAHGTVVSIELNHAGLTAIDPIGPVDQIRWDGAEVKGMDEAMMDEVAEHFAEAALKAKDIGFDMVMLHGAHGWLLGQFLSPYYNTRTDEYGGSLENRARFPLMVIDRVRAAVGKNFPIEYRLSGSECIEGGLELPEAIEFAKMLEGRVDLLHVSAALDVEDEQAVITHPTMFLPHGVNVKYAAEVKKHVSIPVVTIGAIAEPDMAEGILADGKADFVAMVRALIADPLLPNKWRDEREEDVVPCIRCLDCLTGMHTKEQFSCAMNPRTGREFRMDVSVRPAAARKKVLVVGGGAAGMTAAAVAAERGHDVTLAEKTESLGGLLKFTDHDSLKYDLMRYKNYLITRLEKSGARVLLNTEVTPEFIEQGAYDSLIAAVGSKPFRPPVKGLDAPEVRHATTVYTELEKVGQRVVVIGGGLVGCETGLFMSELGKDVTIIEMQAEIAPEANWMHRTGMMQSMTEHAVELCPGHRCLEVRPDGVLTEGPEGERFFPADTVVYAMGMRSNTAEAEALRGYTREYRAVGDCVRARRVVNAVFEATWAAIDLA